MNTFAIVGTTVQGFRRTVTRNVRDENMTSEIALVESWGVTNLDIVPEAF